MKKYLRCFCAALITALYLFLLFPRTPDQDVRFTSYYPGDGTGSSSCTASLLCTSSFETDEDGRFTYNGRVVVAAAVRYCTESTSGVCAYYNALPAGFRQYDLFDEIRIEVNGKKLDAVVLDICGASYWDEEVQRYDIYVKDRASAADVRGKVLGVHRLNVPLFAVSLTLLFSGIFLAVYAKRKKLRLRRSLRRRLSALFSAENQ